MSRTAHAIRADAEAAALVVKDVREDDYDYVAISQGDQTIILSRDQLPLLVRQLWTITAK